MSTRLVAVGVDGARGGWIAAAQFATVRWPDGTRLPMFDYNTPKHTELHFFSGENGRSGLQLLNDWRLAQPGGKRAPVAVDVPIGLCELGGSRPCDSACRSELPGKSSSVFPPPARFLVEQFASGDATADQLRDAIDTRRASEAQAGRDPAAVAGMSTQSCGVFDKVWETDRFVRSSQRPDGTWPVEDWLFEVHPELCFQRMHDGDVARVTAGKEKEAPAGPWPRLAPKKRARGLLQRLALVRRHFTDAQQRVRDLEWSVGGNLDDPLNAEVLGRVATTSGDLAVPRDNDGAGLLMRMVV